jgi:ribulose-5-phosphate 4-epimerase/fuculose-1-phosphate aldolase
MLPRATAWAQQQEELMLGHKESLILVPEGQAIARRAGVSRPAAVRILGVTEIPLPEEKDLREAAVQFGLITPGTAGLTIGHGIFVRQDCLKDPKLIAHELMHVAQYERHGSIPAFLQQYLSEVNQYGYPAAPMEQEAVAFAESVFPSHEK